MLDKLGLALLCLVIMLPRLATPQFGLMDDGRTLATAEAITHGTWDMRVDQMEGRSRPVYWLYFTLFYALSGKNPLGFFIGQTATLALTTLTLAALVQRLTCSRFQGVAAGVLFALSSPVIENFYTLSKGEPAQALLLVLALWVASQISWATPRWAWMGLGALSALLVWGACAAKETALVCLPISLAWLAVAWQRQRRSAGAANLAALGTYSLACLAAALAFVIFRTLTVSSSFVSGTYTNRYDFLLSQVLASVVRWGGWLLRDFIFLLPLLAAVLVVVWKRPHQSPSAGADIQGAALVWAAAWVGLYLPWNLSADYYLLPFALGAAVLGAGWLEVSFTLLKRATETARRAISAALLLLAGLLWLGTLLTNITTARLQLAIDAANAELLRQLAATAPNGSVVWVNIQAENEYVFEIRMLISVLWGRPDFNIHAFKPELLPHGEQPAGRYYILAPTMANQPSQTVRLGVIETTQQHWNNLLAAYQAENAAGTAFRWQVVGSTEQRFNMIGFDFPRLFCPLFPGGSAPDYCRLPSPIVDTRAFRYGWQIYMLVNNEQ
jgi:hypothetical protein